MSWGKSFHLQMNGLFQRKNIVFLFILIALHLAWFIGGMVWQHNLNGDSDEYIFLAKNIQHGFFYCWDATLPVIDYNLTKRTPLYSLLLLGSYRVFGFHQWPVLILQNILSIASCYIILDLFRKLFPATKHIWIYFLFLLAYPSQMFFASVLAPDTILQFFMVLYLRELLISSKAPTKGAVIRMGLLLILATVTKPIVYPFLLLHLIYCIWYAVKTRSALLALIGFIPLITLMGYGLWNQSRTGLYHISSIQSYNLVNSNVRLFLSFKHGLPYSDSVLDVINQKIDQQAGLKAKYELADREAKAVIKSDILGYGVFHLKEMGRFFIDPGKYDFDLYVGLANQELHPDGINFYKEFNRDGIAGGWRFLKSYPLLPFLMLIVCFNVLRVIGWFLFLRDKQFPLVFKVFTTIYIIYFAAVTGPVANTRYFMPVFLLLSALSILGYSGALERKRAKKNLALI